MPEAGAKGSSAGKLDGPLGLAADPSSGNVFVAEGNNSRISEFDVWGQFVKSFGWGVVASGPDNKPARNERQKAIVEATGGSFKFRYLNAFNDGQSSPQDTTPIAVNASASAVQAAFEGLASLVPGDVAVSGAAGGPWTIEFIGHYADSDIPPLQVVKLDSEGHSTLTGGTEDVTVSTIQDGGSYEVCVPAKGDVCQAGQSGGFSPGEIARPNGVAVDAAGNVYVAEVDSEAGRIGEKSLRVQKFDPEGNFLLMLGGSVNKTKAEGPSTEAERNVCTKADLEVTNRCGSGVPGSGKGQFEGWGTGNFIAVGPANVLYVGGKDRIQEFEPSGSYKAEIPLPESGNTGNLAVNRGNGDVYMAFSQNIFNEPPNIYRHTAAGWAKFADVQSPRSIAAAADGSVFGVANPEGFLNELPGQRDRIVEFDSSGVCIVCSNDHFGEFSKLSVLGLATGTACGIAGEDLYASHSGPEENFLRAYGPPPDPQVCPPPKVPPTIVDQYAVSADPDGAVVRAKINPHFWPDTDYYVQYGTGECSKGGCGKSQPAAPGSRLTDQTINAAVTTAGVFLSELQPNTVYHYRFVAKSGGGGPVVGFGGKPGEDGAEGTFTTFPLPSAPSTNCPNQGFRTGASANLPDCRAFEMVSPLEKGNGDIVALSEKGYNQSAVAGAGLVYSSGRAFGDAQAAPYNSEYIATRTQGGWLSHGVSPPRGVNILSALPTLKPQFKLFSADLCSAWLLNDTNSQLTTGVSARFATIYRRSNCEPGTDLYTPLGPLSTAEPQYREPHDFIPQLQGVSADGTHAIFRVPDRLTESGADLGFKKPLLYESFGSGKLRAVCILPSGLTVTTGCSAGTASGEQDDGNTHALSHAISDDGSRIFWSDSPIGEGRLYVRINGKNPTVAVSSGLAQFWTAAADGSKAIFSVGDNHTPSDLYEFDVNTKAPPHLIAHKVMGVLGASDDAALIYLVSEEALDGSAVAGAPNLYLYEAGSGGHFIFIGALSKADTGQGSSNGTAFSPINYEPNRHTAQVSGDGLHATFMSTARLTGFDNTDVLSGQADAEVYVYDAGSKQLHCASCNPTGARPAGREIAASGNTRLWVAARIPAAENQLYMPRVLDDGGGRLFFESFEALVPDDTNGKRDVYQWEAPGNGECSEKDPAYVLSAGGCLSLISSGQSPAESRFIDSNVDGSDVYITTGSSLVSQDVGLVDVYDARVGGGFPPPPSPPEICEGEACQGPSAPPDDPTPASSAFEGAGNVSKAHASHCAKGKARRKGHCAPKRHKHVKRSQHRAADRGGRAER